MNRKLAIIPVRTGSKRLAEKNMKEFFGKPLFTYTIDCALKSGLFDEIHVSTESEQVATIAEEHGVKPVFMRDRELARDDSTLQQVCEFVLDKYKAMNILFDTFCLMWATAPLRTASDVRNGHEMLDEITDAVVGVTNYDLPVFCSQYIDEEGNLSPVFPDKLRISSSQMPSVVCDNGTFCWVRVEAFRQYNSWLPPRLKGYVMPKERSCDIDPLEDWEHAQYLYLKKSDGVSD